MSLICCAVFGGVARRQRKRSYNELLPILWALAVCRLVAVDGNLMFDTVEVGVGSRRDGWGRSRERVEMKRQKGNKIRLIFAQRAIKKLL